MAIEEIIDLSALRTSAGVTRDVTAAVLELRDRRRRLTVEVDALERELRAATTAQESLRSAQEGAEGLIALAREECERLRQHLSGRMERATAVVEEFGGVKVEVLEFHRLRMLAQDETARVRAKVERERASQRELKREYRESSLDLAELSRGLRRIEAEVSSVLSRMGEKP